MPSHAEDISASTPMSRRQGPLASSARPANDSADSGSLAHRFAWPVPAGGAPSRNFDSPRGLLDLASGEKRFRLSRYRPSDELGFFVEHYWIVEWDLCGRANHRQESLPHPSVHIAVERGRSEVVGVVEGRFARVLEGTGRVFGVKFWPGGFYPFFGAPLSELTNRVAHLSDVFGAAAKAFEEAVPTCADDERNVELAEELLRARRPVRDENVVVVREIVDQIAADPHMSKVDDLVPVVDMSKRTLQRLFRRYVGVSPKWVIQRYRLHEAIEEIGRCRPADWAKLALDLGYFDQAHFSKHFKRFVGRSPHEYARCLGTAASD